MQALAGATYLTSGEEAPTRGYCTLVLERHAVEPCQLPSAESSAFMRDVQPVHTKRSHAAHAVATAVIAVALASCRAGDATPVAHQADFPVVHDDRLQLELVASDPAIVTPIGIAVDDRDRVYVLESHTHLPPSAYRGPQGDRVKVFTDPYGDRDPGAVEVFADGIEDGMNLAFSPDGELYVVTARAVWALHDRDDDGVSEARTKVVELVRPEQVYDHAALLGITFSPDGWMYISRGNTGGQAWTLKGTDGSTLSGYGDGGNIVRALPDGSRLSEVATGFWNPFDLKFDAAGRLLAADNDPDSRGPNRLVHVVPGGDYGYQSLYGGSGIHPYLAWNGELPGTMPYAAALGEAPSGILAASRGALPGDYERDLLATIWEESRISRVRLTPRGTSLSGHAEVLVEGGEDFRPVAFAADRRGSIYITDWVLRAYPNHGRGRVWRLSTRPGRIAGGTPCWRSTPPARRGTSACCAKHCARPIPSSARRRWRRSSARSSDPGWCRRRSMQTRTSVWQRC